jgi:4-aminobutyrate aminotransferase
VDAFKEEKILENVNARCVSCLSALFIRTEVFDLLSSAELFEALRELKADPTVGPHILDVRGQGLMVAVEFASPAHSKFDPAVQNKTPLNLSTRVSKRCLEKGLLLLTTSIYETVRFIPALNVSPEDLVKGIRIFKNAVEEVIQET